MDSAAGADGVGVDEDSGSDLLSESRPDLTAHNPPVIAATTTNIFSGAASDNCNDVPLCCLFFCD